MWDSKYLLVLCSYFILSVHGDTDLSQLHVLEDNVITIDSVLDASGEWENIRIEMDPSFTPNDTSIEVTRRLIEDNGKKKVVISLAVKGSFEGFTRTPLKFHSKGGKNLIVTNDGMTAKRINTNVEGDGGVLTNRVLAYDELFQVRIDKLLQRYVNSIGIGVTHHNLKTIDYTKWMMCGVNMIYRDLLYENDSRKETFGPSFKTLEVGDIVGVMKKRNGDLHYFINGEDLGVTATGINYPVHGVVDLYGNAIQATIIPQNS